MFAVADDRIQDALLNLSKVARRTKQNVHICYHECVDVIAFELARFFIGLRSRKSGQKIRTQTKPSTTRK